MRLAIVGPRLSGKTTLFNALTGLEASTGPGPVDAVNLGVFQVPDPSLDRLAALLDIPRVTYVHIEIVDVPGFAGQAGAAPRGLDEKLLHHARLADALIMVVRSFQNPTVPTPTGGVDPAADLGAAWADMVISDLASAENRLGRLRPLAAKGGASAEEKVELEALERIRDELEEGRGVADTGLSEEEQRLLRGFGFLTAKPMLVVFNVGEESLPAAVDPVWEEALGDRGDHALALCAELAAELASMEPADAETFAGEYGVPAESGREIIRAAYEVLDVVTFYTSVGEKEARAWTLRRGGTALEAAEEVHSDIARGFIKADVVGIDDLLGVGSYTEARKSGLLHQEGKAYLIQDRDVIHIKFAV